MPRASIPRDQERARKNLKLLSEFAGRADEFDALLFPGDHGTMVDLAEHE